ncbi:OsmC family protein [Bacillus sp. AK128]
MTKTLNFNITSTAKGILTEIHAIEHQYLLDEPVKAGGEDKGPTPLHALLGALAGCKSITAFAAAKSMGIEVEEITFELNAELDPRGMKGKKDVKTYFEKVEIHVQLKTNESIEQINALKHKVEERCPVFNLFKAADVKMVQHWEIVN